MRHFCPWVYTVGGPSVSLTIVHMFTGSHVHMGVGGPSLTIVHWMNDVSSGLSFFFLRNRVYFTITFFQFNTFNKNSINPHLQHFMPLSSCIMSISLLLRQISEKIIFSRRQNTPSHSVLMQRMVGWLAISLLEILKGALLILMVE